MWRVITSVSLGGCLFGGMTIYTRIPKAYKNFRKKSPFFAHKVPAPSSRPLTPFVLQLNRGRAREIIPHISKDRI